ncbi:uncharacterized protein APUU_11624A [Aspergillus puulaauensis]|uniref:HMG box domain-containing protein n=1 Tax=Aspergillus puulaauensis TaxID=1220207 RepID=A0A7R7XCB4_9EURO|nr:uncharacterized protein APUU_11624A [Aspergillus puulaauensis]BCS18796.1 hypothetical protein APUU_11624A [Aspergillus puulaauensis]
MPKNDPKTVTVNVEEFTRTRDSVLASIAQLQSAAFELSRAYINHSNAVLGEENSNVDFTTITNALTASLKEAGLVGAPISGAGGEPGPGEKRKRKRTDPNAPKRTLTPFFLYMHHNRRHIAEELGSDAKPKEVSNEGTRRWAEMPESQKEVWKKLYADNLATYREKVAAYKAGLPYDHDDNDKAADQLHLDVAAAEGSGDEDEESEDEEEEEESSPEPAKEPTPPPPTKRRRSEGKPKEASSPVTEKKPRNKSPEKKKRAPAKKDKETPRKTAPAETGKQTKKKRKSEVGNDE